MRIKAQPQDFVVKELAQLPLSTEGDFVIYRVQKQNVTTLKVQAYIAAQPHKRSSDVQAPALKDKRSAATQYLCVRGTGPAALEGTGYQAHFVGRSHRHPRPSDLTGNRFTIVLRDLPRGEASTIQEHLHKVTRDGLPNF